jgi:hypothetical protein
MVDAPGGAMPLRDWLKHLAVVDAWPVVVCRLYTRAAADPEIPEYFRGVHMEQPQRHFLATLMIVIGQGGHRGRRIANAGSHSGHSGVRNSRRADQRSHLGRMIGVLGGVLGELGTPPAGDPGCAGHYDRPDPLGDRGRARGHGPVSQELDTTVYC